MRTLPPLNALRAFEAAARHLSLTKAAQELHVTPGALSHQIRGLEGQLGVSLFDRGVRSISLTPAGERLHPGLRAAFIQMREAVASVADAQDERVLVVSTLPGFTAKWLAPRMYRFSVAHPEIDARVSSSAALANFVTDRVDVAIRNLPIGAAIAPELVAEKLMDIAFTPVCSPKLIDAQGPLESPAGLRNVALIHDDSLRNQSRIPGWSHWLERAGVPDIDLSRGLRFSSADHALDATVEGAGVLLAPNVLAYDELRTGRLVMPFDFMLSSGRAYHFVCLKARLDRPKVRAFRAWVRAEADLVDWSTCRSSYTKPVDPAK